LAVMRRPLQYPAGDWQHADSDQAARGCRMAV
jgi:hypothetical protein